jgi:hypothetical protein
LTSSLLAALLVAFTVPAAPRAQSRRQTIDLAQAFDAGKLRAVKRNVTKIPEQNGVRLSGAPGNGVAWLEGTDFRTGAIEVDVRSPGPPEDVSIGVAFHRKDDNTYEAVFVRPANFRAADPARKQHAVQYMVLPDYDWPRLRKEFAEQFENPVDSSVAPTGWVKLRVAVDSTKLQVTVGNVKDITLEVRKLGSLDAGRIGLWVGDGSRGEFANLAITPSPD